MPAQSGFTTFETLPSESRVHVIGAGPVGLLLTALLQSSGRFSVRLYEKRREYTRNRMVKLSPYLVADSIASYFTDYVDAESVEAIFEPSELEEGIAFRQSIPSDLMGLLQGWTEGFCPLKTLERSLSDLIDARQSQRVERIAVAVTEQDAISMLRPGDVLIDCTGTKSLLRNQLAPSAGETDGEANTFKIRLEYALVVTFLYGRSYDCNEYCKYYKNIENAHYKFIPAVNRTYFDGNITHVTGIIKVPVEDYERMPSRFDGRWLRDNFPQIAQSMDRFIAKVDTETDGEMIGDLEILRIALELYRARNATNRRVTASGDRRPPIRPLAGVPGRRFRCGLTLLPVDLPRLRLRDVSGGTSGAARPAADGCAGSLRAVHVQAVAPGVRAQQDDQAEQGPVRVHRRQLRATGQAAHLLTGACDALVAPSTKGDRSGIVTAATRETQAATR